MVVDVILSRLCVSMISGRVIYLFELEKGEVVKYLFRAADVWWRSFVVNCVLVLKCCECVLYVSFGCKVRPWVVQCCLF